MDEATQASTTAFFTLDAFNGDLASRVMTAIEEAMEGGEDGWTNLVEAEPDLHLRLTQQGIQNPASYSSIQWDPAMILFTSCVELTNDGDNTLLRYSAKAETGGKIAQLGSRLITSTARKLSKAFFENFEKIMRGETSIDAGDGDTASATT